MYNGSYSPTPTVPGSPHPTGPYSVPESIESRILSNETSSYLSLPPSAGLSHPSHSPLPSGFNHTGSVSSGPITGESSDSYTRASFGIQSWTGHPWGTGYPSSSPLSSNSSHPSGSGDRNGTYNSSTGAMTSGYPSVSLSRHHNSTSTTTIKTTITVSTLTTTVTPYSSPESPVTASNSTLISPTAYVPSGGYTPSASIASSPVISSNSTAPYPSTTHMTVYLNTSSTTTSTTSILLTTGPSTSTLWSPVTASSSPSPYRNSTTSTAETLTSTSSIPTIPPAGYPSSNTNGEHSGTFPAHSVPSRSIPSNGFSSYITRSSSFPVSPVTVSSSSASILTSAPVYWPPVSFATGVSVVASSSVKSPASTSGLPGYSGYGYGGWGSGWWKLFR